MKALKVMWSDTRMVVLTALCAALYAAILIPFKFFPIIPGVTEIRPANAIPIALSLLFGPAAAWGSGFGNLVGDFAFGFGPGSFFGMIGNFLYGFAPYALWRALLGDAEPDPRKALHWAVLVFACIVASAACAYSIAWGIDVFIRGVPFAILGTIIFFNNLLIALLLAPPLLFALLPRVRAWGLLYTRILPPAAAHRPRFALLGALLFTAGSLGGLAGGLGIATGMYGQRMSVPWFVAQLKAVVSPVGEAAPAAAGGKPSAATAVSAGAPVPASATVAAPGPALSPRAALGWGLVPAVILTFLGLLLL